MFDKKKLEAFLDSLEVSTHFPSEAPKKIVLPPQSALDEKMNKYDIYMQGDYKNVGTPEFPIWAKPPGSSIDPFDGVMYMPLQWAGRAYYGGISRAPMAYSPYDDKPQPPPVVETPHQKLQKKIASLQSVAPAKIENPKPVPPPAPRSPDYVGTLTAWRGWGVRAGQLVALGSDYGWVTKKAQKAHCQHESHQAPQMDCGCGFWSFKTLDILTKALGGYLDTVVVVGTVEIWGRVIECENGYRSEYAYPKELWLLDEENDLSQLSWTYGVPVRKYVPPCTALVPYRKGIK